MNTQTGSVILSLHMYTSVMRAGSVCRKQQKIESTFNGQMLES